jgi:hypothetical protein
MHAIPVFGVNGSQLLRDLVFSVRVVVWGCMNNSHSSWNRTIGTCSPAHGDVGELDYTNNSHRKCFRKIHNDPRLHYARVACSGCMSKSHTTKSRNTCTDS